MKVAVYCSAKDSIPAEYLALGDQVGCRLARNGHSLVYGGATGGLMTRVSEAFKQTAQTLLQDERGEIIGVVPQRIIYSGRRATNCDHLIEVGTMSERKETMRQEADCFVCLPGSYGTLDEMFDVIASGTVGEHKKPIYILNYKGFYNSLREQISLMKKLQFIPEVEQYKPCFADTIEELFNHINTQRV